MPETRGKINDIKVVIRETIQELFSEQDFLSRLADKLLEKIKLPDVSVLRDVGAVIETQNTEFTAAVEAQNVKITNLEKDNEILRRQIDRIEQHSRRKQLRLIGVKETGGENLTEIVQGILRDKLKLNGVKLSGCFRIGKRGSASDGPRQIMLRLASYDDRSLIMRERKLLKGTGIVVVEDLTGARHRLLRAAQDAFGKTKVWTLEGSIYTRVGSERFCIANMQDMEGLMSRRTAVDCVQSVIENV